MTYSTDSTSDLNKGFTYAYCLPVLTTPVLPHCPLRRWETNVTLPPFPEVLPLQPGALLPISPFWQSPISWARSVHGVNPCTMELYWPYWLLFYHFTATLCRHHPEVKAQLKRRGRLGVSPEATPEYSCCLYPSPYFRTCQRC